MKKKQNRTEQKQNRTEPSKTGIMYGYIKCGHNLQLIKCHVCFNAVLIVYIYICNSSTLCPVNVLYMCLSQHTLFSSHYSISFTLSLSLFLSLCECMVVNIESRKFFWLLKTHKPHIILNQKMNNRATEIVYCARMLFFSPQTITETA